MSPVSFSVNNTNWTIFSSFLFFLGGDQDGGTDFGGLGSECVYGARYETLKYSIINILCWENSQNPWILGLKRHRNDCSYIFQDDPKHIYTHIHILFFKKHANHDYWCTMNLKQKSKT